MSDHRRFFFPFAFAALFLVISGVVMFLWNAVLPEVTGVKMLTYWQAAGLLALSKILFGNFNFGRHRMPPFAHRGIREKWMNMTHDEKEKFREEWKKRC